MEILNDTRLYGTWRRYKIVAKNQVTLDDGNLWQINEDGTAQHSYKFNSKWVMDEKKYTCYRKNGIIWLEDNVIYKSIITVISEIEICITGENSLIKSYFSKVDK